MAVHLWLLRGFIAIAVMSITLIAADRVIGWLSGPVVKPVNAMGLTSGISTAGTHLRPGFEGRYTNAEFSISVRVNSDGLRGPEIERSSSRGEHLVLALGDSFTFGQGVEFEEAWPALVDRQLGPSVKIVNAGWAAGSPLGYSRYLEDRGLAFEPDVVIIAMFVGNDVVEDMAERDAVTDGLARLEYESRYIHNLGLHVGLIGAIRQFIDNTLPNIYELSTLSLVKMQYLLGGHRSHFDHILADASDPELERGWVETLSTLGRIDSTVRSRGAGFGIVLIPFYDQVASTMYGPGFTKEKPQRRILSFCAEARIACLDLLPALRNGSEPETLYYLKDGHWTARGQLIAASAIASWMRDTRLVPVP